MIIQLFFFSFFNKNKWRKKNGCFGRRLKIIGLIKRIHISGYYDSNRSNSKRRYWELRWWRWPKDRQRAWLHPKPFPPHLQSNLSLHKNFKIITRYLHNLQWSLRTNLYTQYQSSLISLMLAAMMPTITIAQMKEIKAVATCQ